MTHENDSKDEAVNTVMTVTERERLQAMLTELPDTMPPRAVWKRIEEQGRAEGLLFGGRAPNALRWVAGSAVAAMVALAVLRLPDSGSIDERPTQETVASHTPSFDEVEGNGAVVDLQTLMVQSQQLERNLRALPRAPQVVRVSTAATISDLEDRIAAIDYYLNHPSGRLSRQEAEIYWRERVRLMRLLVNLRYAQVQRIAY